MKHQGRLAGLVLGLFVLAQTGAASADVVPARKAKADRDAAKVEERLASIGADASAARSGADRLTPSELRYFAEDPSRVQNVGGMTWGEAAAGTVYLGLMGFLYFAFVSNQN